MLPAPELSDLNTGASGASGGPAAGGGGTAAWLLPDPTLRHHHRDLGGSPGGSCSQGLLSHNTLRQQASGGLPERLGLPLPRGRGDRVHLLSSCCWGDAGGLGAAPSSHCLPCSPGGVLSPQVPWRLHVPSNAAARLLRRLFQTASSVKTTARARTDTLTVWANGLHSQAGWLGRQTWHAVQTYQRIMFAWGCCSRVEPSMVV
jgi:hypothetical protein